MKSLSFSASKTFSTFIGGLVPWLLLTAVLIGALVFLSSLSIGLHFFFVLLGILVLFLFWLGATYFLFVFFLVSYEFTEKGLNVHWGLITCLIPLDDLRVQKNPQRFLLPAKKKFFLGSELFFPSKFLHLQYEDSIFLVNPADAVGFLSTLYKVAKVNETRTTKNEIQQQVVFSFPLKSYLQNLSDTLLSFLFFFDMLLLLGLNGFAMWAVGELPAQTILRYSVLQGIDLVGNRDQILLFGGLSLIFFVILSCVSFIFYKYERIAAYIALGFYPFLQLGLAITIFSVFKVAG